MPDKAVVAAAISAEMGAVAQPDSHFHLDFTQFIPGFDGSEQAAERLIAAPVCRDAGAIFVTPDNGLIPLRRQLLEAGRDIVLPSYFLHRGFMLIEAARVPAGQAVFASWLDGIDHFGRPVSLAELEARGRFDLIAAGASAVAANGLRFGMGSVYLDVEWGVFCEAGIVDEGTRIAAVVHDRQLFDQALPVVATDVPADLVATPTRLIELSRLPRPRRLDWSLVDDHLAESPPVMELKAQTRSSARRP